MLIKNDKGLLENLYSFIQYNVESPYTFIEKFKEEYNIDIEPISYISTIKHVFTHKTWYMNIYEFKVNQAFDHLYTLKQIEEIPISSAHRKVLKAYNREG